MNPDTIADLQQNAVRPTILSANLNVNVSHQDALDMLGRARRLVGTMGNKMQAEKLINEDEMLQSQSTISAPFCRICRGNGDRTPLIECPCQCKGSMGFVHEICLQKWHVVRKAKVCEICHAHYEFPDLAPEPNFWMLFVTFFRTDCLGRIAKCLINFAALTCLAYINSKQIQLLIEVSRDVPASPMLIIYLMFTGISNFTYFEWTIHSINKLSMVLERWWTRTSRYSFGDFDDLLADIQADEDELRWTFISDTN